MTELYNAILASTSPLVQLWISWMVFVFLAALFFIRHPQAQRALLVLIATSLGGYILWTMTHNVHLLGIVHILIWLPLAVYLWQSILSKSARRHDGEADVSKYHTLTYKAFFTWVCLLFATIVISLIFDARDIAMVIAGNK